MPHGTTLDHVVVNAMFGTDAALARFGALGFAPTPRGYHSLGSINHLMMFPDHYLELVGLPVGADKLRQEILDSRIGIDGLVLKTPDAQRTFERLVAAGVKAGEPQSFSRPVEIDGVQQRAEFTTTRLTPGELPAGRVYFCEHRTPQWVFRPEWSVHPNGARRLVELVVVGPDPAADECAYARVAGSSEPAGSTSLAFGAFALRFVDEDGCRARYGALIGAEAEPAQRFAALVVEVDDLAALRARVAKLAGIRVAETFHRAAATPSVSVRLDELHTVIEFIGAVEHAHSP